MKNKLSNRIISSVKYSSKAVNNFLLKDRVQRKVGQSKQLFRKIKKLDLINKSKYVITEISHSDEVKELKTTIKQTFKKKENEE